MILEFGAKNYLSFKEGVNISFEIGKAGEKKVSNGNGISNLLCLKGKNGAGKTNILGLLSFIQGVNVSSFEKKPDEDFAYKSFFHNDESTEAYIIFQIENIIYEYNLSFTMKNIISESLYMGRNRDKLLFKRENNKIIEVDSAFTNLKRIKIRSNVSIINLAHQYEIDAINKFYNFFFMKLICNSDGFKLLDNMFTHEEITKYYNDDSKMFKFCIDFLKESDLGIENIIIEEKLNSDDKKVYIPVFHYKTSSGEKNLFYQHQSGGVKKLYKSLFLYFLALSGGGIAVIDELDLHIHPHLVPKLFDLFDDKTINTKNAQLIFTSHLTEIIDTMGKYRTYIIEKEENESFAYRLDEIENPPIRNDRPISPLYKKGLLGGVPKI